VELPTSGQCHLANEATPRNGNLSRGGVSRRSSKNRLLRNSYARPALMVAQRPAAIDILFDVGWDGALASGGYAILVARHTNAIVFFLAQEVKRDLLRLCAAI